METETNSKGLPGLEVFRARKGFTQEGLARSIDVTVGHLWKVARGRSNPSTEMVQRLCSVLECSPNDLMGWDGKAAS